MYIPRPEERHRMLVAMIAESLLLADDLDLPMVGIWLDGALAGLIGGGAAARGEIAH